MLRNSWVITDKEPILGKRGHFNYTILPVDGTSGAYDEDGDAEMWGQCIQSIQNLDVGTHTNDELTPLHEIYEAYNTDIATVEFTRIDLQQFDAVRLYLFGRRFGEFYFLMDPEHQVFKIKRGDYLMIQRTYDCSNICEIRDDDYDDDDDEDVQDRPPVVGIPLFHPLYNITTKQKSKYYATADIKDEDCDKVVVLGKTPKEDSKRDLSKLLFINSRKFGRHICCCFDEYEPEFRTRTGDKVLLQKYRSRNTGRYEYRILSNLTIDSMRNKFLLNTK